VPQRETRRMAVRRTLPPRPTYEDGTAPGASGQSTRLSRPARLVQREAPYMFDELKRIAIVTGTCVALLAVLTVVDRLR
jgi:hypothetical protein